MRRTAQESAGTRPPAWTLIIGIVVLVLLFGLPLIGWAIRLVAMTAGFGALWVAVWHGLRAPAGAAP